MREAPVVIAEFTNSFEAKIVRSRLTVRQDTIKGKKTRAPE
jgi:hypothetical protein